MTQSSMSWSGNTWWERFALAHLAGGMVVLGCYALTDASWRDSLRPGQLVAAILFVGWSLLVQLKRLRR